MSLRSCSGSGNLSFDASMQIYAASWLPVHCFPRNPLGYEVEGRVHRGPIQNNEIALLTRFDLGCDEPDVIHTGLMPDIENIRNRREVEGGIPLDEHHFLGACSKNAFELIQ